MKPRLALACLAIALPAVLQPSAARAEALPDGRAYELVSNLGAAGEGALNGGRPIFVAAAEAGGEADWQAAGACCGAGSGSVNTYQSVRAAGGWSTQAISSTPEQQPVGLEAQETAFVSSDLSRTIFLTPASYVPGDKRPARGGDDLYLRDPLGELEWLSQGPVGTGTEADSARFDGATHDAETVLFSTAEQLTANASGLEDNRWAQYLYARDVRDGTTSLVDVDTAGAPIGTRGATLGDAGIPVEPFAGGYRGSVTNAISEDGSKIFFETPPAGVEGLSETVEPHLYMRDMSDGTTTPLDNPATVGEAHFQGASADGSLVFFTSNEGLDGAPAVDELYVFNTTASAVGIVPPMSSLPVAHGAGILGVTAVSNDASHVYFAADAVLTVGANPLAQSAVANRPNLYVYDTQTGETSFVASLAPTDVSSCKPTCESHTSAGLIKSADIFRPAYTSPNGSVLVFQSSEDVTGEKHSPSTTLTYGASAGEYTITVGSTEGLLAGHTIAIGSGEQEELAKIERIDSPTELTFVEYDYGLAEEHEPGTSVTALSGEIYRYAPSEDSLTCLSCTPAGVAETASASLGEAAGGSYDPNGNDPQMSEDGSRVFFDSPDPLLPDMAAAQTQSISEPGNLYEWEHGELHLISDARTGGAEFDGTTLTGDDVFFSSSAALTPGASPGYSHIYDARVGGGFPVQQPSPPGPCAREACLSLPEAVPFALLPASATLDEQDVEPIRKPTFSVGSISAAQRAELARRGTLRLSIRASARSEVLARASAYLGGRRMRVAAASAMLGGSGRLELVLKLDRMARVHLARSGVLRLRVEVEYQKTGAVARSEWVIHTTAASPASKSGSRQHA